MLRVCLHTRMMMRRKTWIAFFIGLMCFVMMLIGYHAYLRYSTSVEMKTFEQPSPPIKRILPPITRKTIKILSINGGGIRGILLLSMLAYIERHTGKPISESFDFIVATSSGSITATLLSMPNQEGKPKYNIDQIIQLYLLQGQKIFHVPWYHRLLTLGGLLGPKFVNQPRIHLVKKLYGQTRFDQLLTNVMIPIYNVTLGKPMIYQNWYVPEQYDYNYLVSGVVLGAISTPIAFS